MHEEPHNHFFFLCGAAKWAPSPWPGWHDTPGLFKTMASTCGWVNLSNPTVTGPYVPVFCEIREHKPHSHLWVPVHASSTEAEGGIQANWRDKDELWHAMCGHLVHQRPSTHSETQLSFFKLTFLPKIKVWQSANEDRPGASGLPALYNN